jgi:hypothetical protein
MRTARTLTSIRRMRNLVVAGGDWLRATAKADLQYRPRAALLIASVLARLLLTVGSMQKSRAMPAALPDPRTTRRLSEPSGAGRDFSFEPVTIRSGSGGLVAGPATMGQSESIVAPFLLLR